MVTRAGSPGIVRLIIGQLDRHPDQMAQHRSALFALYIEQVLSAKERPSAAVLAGWAPLAASVSHDELAGTLLPAIQRMVKRNPDIALPSVARLLAGVKVDLSRYVDPLLVLLLQQGRHAKDTVRCAAA